MFKEKKASHMTKCDHMVQTYKLNSGEAKTVPLVLSTKSQLLSYLCVGLREQGEQLLRSDIPCCVLVSKSKQTNMHNLKSKINLKDNNNILLKRVRKGK